MDTWGGCSSNDPEYLCGQPKPSEPFFYLQTEPQINSKLSQVLAKPHSLPLTLQSWVEDCSDNSTSPCPLWRALRTNTRGNEQLWGPGQNLHQIMRMRVVNVQINQKHWPALLEMRERCVGPHLKVHSVETKMKMLARGWRTWLHSEPKVGTQGGTKLLQCQTLQFSQDNPDIFCTFKILQITSRRELKCLAWVFLQIQAAFPVICTISFRATWQELESLINLICSFLWGRIL